MIVDDISIYKMKLHTCAAFGMMENIIVVINLCLARWLASMCSYQSNKAIEFYIYGWFLKINIFNDMGHFFPNWIK